MAGTASEGRTDPGDGRPPDRPGLKERVRHLYEEHDGFRVAMAAFDMATVAFFVVTTFMPLHVWILWADYAIGTLLLADLSARLWTARDRTRLAASWWTLVDVLVIASMLAPLLVSNYAFLRILRAVRLLRTYAMIRSLRRGNGWFARNAEVVTAATNLLVFIFIVSAVVYVDQVGENPEITQYLDAVYFTTTTLTTTGFGDITLQGAHGRMLSIVIMVLGVGLFVKFAQSVFRPSKAVVECKACGLSRHDHDAVHCKHCGAVVNIPNEGNV